MLRLGTRFWRGQTEFYLSWKETGLWYWEEKNLGLFILLLTWCTISLKSLSQTVILAYCTKNNNKGDKYQNTVFNPGIKGLEIRYFKIKTFVPSLCLFDAIYGVWSHYVNYISLYYVPKNLFKTQNYWSKYKKKHCI